MRGSHRRPLGPDRFHVTQRAARTWVRAEFAEIPARYRPGNRNMINCFPVPCLKGFFLYDYSARLGRHRRFIGISGRAVCTVYRAHCTMLPRPLRHVSPRLALEVRAEPPDEQG